MLACLGDREDGRIGIREVRVHRNELAEAAVLGG
jgi:hypothetical protein